jgi:hypothetical protein
VNALPQKVRDGFLGRGVLHGEIDLLLGLTKQRKRSIEIDERTWNQAAPKKGAEKDK